MRFCGGKIVLKQIGRACVPAQVNPWALLSSSSTKVPPYTHVLCFVKCILFAFANKALSICSSVVHFRNRKSDLSFFTTWFTGLQMFNRSYEHRRCLHPWGWDFWEMPAWHCAIELCICCKFSLVGVRTWTWCCDARTFVHWRGRVFDTKRIWIHASCTRLHHVDRYFSTGVCYKYFVRKWNCFSLIFS